jgi:dCTP diphosphatase
MKTDKDTTIQELREYMDKFHADRDWDKHHTPKNLSMSIAIEAAELMEHFQWNETPRDKEEVCDEMADIISYILAMAQALDVDISTLFFNKMKKCEAKYPVEIFNANNTERLADYYQIKKDHRKGKEQ